MKLTTNTKISVRRRMPANGRRNPAQDPGEEACVPADPFQGLVSAWLCDEGVDRAVFGDDEFAHGVPSLSS